MKARINCILALLMLATVAAWAQKRAAASPWVKIVDNETSTIYYNKNIQTNSRGNHIVWVKAVFHTSDWQRYLAQQIGSRVPVYSTKTKAMYDADYNYAMVRQVIAYSKAGKQLANTGDDTSAGWLPVNASDPVGLVGEYLGNLQNGQDDGNADDGSDDGQDEDDDYGE